MSGLPDKENGSEFRGVGILPDRSCLRAFMVSLVLGRREIPLCSYAFIEGVIAGVKGVSLQIKHMIRPSHPCSSDSWPI